MHSSSAIALLVVALTVVCAAISPDHLVLLALGLVLAAGVWLLWPRADAPVMLLAFGLQWLQVAVKPIETVFGGQRLDDLSDFGAPLTPAVGLAIAGVAALGLGLWAGAGGRRVDWGRSLGRDAHAWSQREVIPMALGLIVLGHAVALAAYHVGGGMQIFLALGGARNAGLFILAYWCLREGKALALLAAVVVLEIVVGLTGFFAGFRESLLVLLVAAAAARPRLDLRGIFAAGVVVSLVLAVGVFWTAIKPDYRDFLNQGSGQQEVTQSVGARLSYVGKAADEFKADQVQIGMKDLVARISYIDFLAETLKHVPDYVPHEDGRRLGAALLNIVTPRIFFPDKPPTPDDSAVTAQYTGLRLGLGGGTSISIGYLGELYIDFGYVGAVVGAFAIGLFGGLAHRTLRGYGGIPLFFSYGLSAMLMVAFTAFETDLVRFLGSIVTIFAACLVLQRLVAPQVLLTLSARMARPVPR